MLEGPLELPPVAAALDALARAPEAFGPRLVAFCLEQSQRRSRRATKQEQRRGPWPYVFGLARQTPRPRSGVGASPRLECSEAVVDFGVSFGDHYWALGRDFGAVGVGLGGLDFTRRR